MKLLQTNLYDPEPKNPNVTLPFETSTDKELAINYSNNYSEWKKRQVKPTQPKSVYSHNSPSLWILRGKIEPQGAKEWSDYYEALNYYEQHRLKYEGFSEVEGFSEERHFETDELYVIFSNGICNEFQIIDKAVYRGEETTTELIEMIAKINGAELKKL